MILIIDNYDSFTFNLYQLIGEINPDIKVVRNDKLTIEDIRATGSYYYFAGAGQSQAGRYLSGGYPSACR